jgi:hypothetical protein
VIFTHFGACLGVNSEHLEHYVFSYASELDQHIVGICKLLTSVNYTN